MRAETCSCYVILINYNLCNKVVLDYKFMCFIKPFVILTFPHPPSLLPSLHNPYVSSPSISHCRPSTILTFPHPASLLPSLHNPYVSSPSISPAVSPQSLRFLTQHLSCRLSTILTFPHPAPLLPSLHNPYLALHIFGQLRNCSQLLVISGS